MFPLYAGIALYAASFGLASTGRAWEALIAGVAATIVIMKGTR